jgi:predicted 3-demethylubiquinone-9 3-methyltransferase (glyoxalase superfamily)
MVNCETQEEIDGALGKVIGRGGTIVECGWLKDKYGLSWQIVPTISCELLKGDDSERSQRVMKAILQMKKLEIADLERPCRQQ